MAENGAGGICWASATQGPNLISLSTYPISSLPFPEVVVCHLCETNTVPYSISRAKNVFGNVQSELTKMRCSMGSWMEWGRVWSSFKGLFLFITLHLCSLLFYVLSMPQCFAPSFRV